MIAWRARDFGLVSLATVFVLLATYAAMMHRDLKLLLAILAAFLACWIALQMGKTFRADQAGTTRILAEAIPQIVWIADANGHTTYINKQWYRMTGRSEGGELGSGWIESVHPDDRAPCREKWE